MSILHKLRCLLPSRRRVEEREMQEELQALREIAGPSELGNLTIAAENARGVFTWIWLERLMQDLRYGIRAMSGNKTFTVMAVLSLALAIGANTAIYSFIESILYRSLPVPDPNSLVIMKWRTKGGFPSVSRGLSFSTGGNYLDPKEGATGTIFPYPALQLFQSNKDILSTAFCYFAVERFSVTTGGRTDALKGTYVSGDYFQGMGLPAAAGRLIFPSDDGPDASTVAVLSYRMAEQRFGDIRRAIGQTIRINDKRVTVVGVAPSAFFGAEPGSVPDVYVPIHSKTVLEPPPPRVLNQPFTDANYYWIEVMGRLNKGVTLEQAQAVLAPQFMRFIESTVTDNKQRADLPVLKMTAGGEGLDTLRRQYAKPIYVLAAMVALILLIACANIANLLLARAAARAREIGVRLSIGAGRLRVIRQLLTESMLLSAIAGVLGVAFAWWCMWGLTHLLANRRENFTLHAELNWQVLTVTFGLSLFTALLFGLAPAIDATRIDIVSAVKGSATDTPGRRRLGLSNVLIVVQIGMSLLLLVAAGLFGRTLSNLHSIRLGFNRENVLLFTINPANASYSGPSLMSVYENLRQRLEGIPGVRAVSLSTLPLPAGGGTLGSVTVDGMTPPAQNRAGFFSTGPEFFATMQIPLFAGRDFSEHDRADAPLVAIVNQQFEKVYGVDHATGRTIAIGDTKYEIIGVASDALFLMLKEDYRPMVYRPYMQNPRPPAQMTFEVRTAGNPLGQAETIRQIVREFDSRLAVADMKTQAAHIDQAISQEITLARLCTMFAGLALIIACVGLYGMVSFNVAQRTKEIGIRVALGATTRRVIWLVLREVLGLAIFGLGLGIPIVLWGSRFVKSLLYGIQPNDAASIVAAFGILLSAGLLAGYLPARRASRIDPTRSMRYE